MNHDKLLIRFLADELSPVEKRRVSARLLTDNDLQQRLDQLRGFWDEKNEELEISPKQASDWTNLTNRLNLTKDSSIIALTQRSIPKWFIRIAAVLIIALGTTLIWDSQRSFETVKGRTDEPIASRLPDGTEVYLTKGSKLTYPKTFASDSRLVQLSGEGYFDVVGDPKYPFIVDTGQTKVSVTGTTFRIKASGKSEEVAVLVRAGKVLFYNSEILTENSFKVGLGPGDVGTYYPKLNQLNKSHNKDYKHLNWN
ncbi:MAG: hypothetical protein HN352_11425 [Bacteroidetes bacterium]|jgi:transmembrane sensor|nr:hypothetical protein [Bacteroidota bacterium]MBT3751623.1 hypothetical protein [Bacteroidota bacterium]MBT4398352.1 hypothetical protein [Bacteroidota bacterium]MBT4411536.1 hypothetical protein [Bacteroidota bacterium]MBT7464763.1 hypothetical protein [Bacteroidota bacterium]